MPSSICGDVAYVHRGGPPQQNIVLVQGPAGRPARDPQDRRCLDAGGRQRRARRSCRQMLKTLPPGRDDHAAERRLDLRARLDRGRRAGDGDGRPSWPASTVLLFVGSWRSTLIVATSIPLSILCSILALSWLGQTINVMTLGGLALAVGILVDDATVMIENINAHLEEADDGGSRKSLEQAIIEAANQIVVPTFVSTLCICIVWLPLFQLGGVAGYLFLPLAEAIIFAMIASFILSRTLTPTMAACCCAARSRRSMNPAQRKRPGLLRALPGAASRRRFERFREPLSRRCWSGWPQRRRPLRRALPRAAPWPRRCCCCCSSGRISFRASSPARSPCICARPSARASRRRRSRGRWWTSRSATCCPAMSPARC